MSARFLVDTQAFIEIRAGSVPLSLKVKKIFLDSKVSLFLSIASVWEMQIKLSIKKLELDIPLKELVESAIATPGFSLLPINPDHIYALGSLKYHHRDPFDRLLVAQSAVERMAIISSDKVFDLYGLERIW